MQSSQRLALFIVGYHLLFPLNIASKASSPKRHAVQSPCAYPAATISSWQRKPLMTCWSGTAVTTPTRATI